jgi:hypothetical protein
MAGLQLKKLSYFERRGAPKEWTLGGLILGPINLLVGRNATGKTRALNVIWNLSGSLLPEVNFRPNYSGYDLLFDNDGESYQYVLEVVQGKVTHEQVIVDNEIKLDRGPGGEGVIYAQEEKKTIRFKPPENELAAVARLDLIQHSFLAPLNAWALAVRHYSFGSTLGKDRLAVLMKGAPEANDRDAQSVVAIFRKAVKEFGSRFVDALIDDMGKLDYPLTKVEVAAPETVKLVGPGEPELVSVVVQEKGMVGLFDQNEMSDGMFGALSLLIQVNYSQLARRANCILIDDIGEGLDFERSSRLIEILRLKAQQSAFQLIMTTNDQFVMNRVPLEEWSVLQRQGGHVHVKNYQNSRKEFEHFKFVGLSNFALFEMDFLNASPPEEAIAP